MPATLNFRAITWAFALALALAAPLGKAALAQALPALRELPPDTARAHADIAQRRAALVKEREALRQHEKALNADCGAVEEGSSKVAPCIKAAKAFDVEAESHIRKTNAFNAIAASAASQAKVLRPDLPKAIDESIARTPVGDRARQGVVAVQNYDWQVALGWFLDAQDAAPDDVGVARLAAFARYALEQHGSDSRLTELARETVLAALMDETLDRFVRERLPGNPQLSRDLSPDAKAAMNAQTPRAQSSAPVSMLSVLTKMLNYSAPVAGVRSAILAVRG